MAYPQVGNTSAGSTARDTEHIITLPANIAVGNLLLVFFATDGDNTISDWDGFTEIFSVSKDTAASLHIAYKIAVGSDTLTVTTTSSEESSYICFRITGHNTSQMPEASTGVWGFALEPNPDSLTPTGGAKDYLWFAAEGNDHADTTSAWPLPDNNLEETGGAPGSCNIGVCSDELNQSSLDPGSFTIDNDEEWVAGTVAVHPVTGAQTFYQNTGQGVAAPTGVLNKKGFKDTGGYGMTIVGTLATATIFLRVVGSYAMTITGTLSKIPTFACVCGGYVINIAGSLVRKTSKTVGSYAITIMGSLVKKTSKNVGGYAMNIVGVLVAATIYLQVVGSYAMAIAGTLTKKTFKFVGGGVVEPVGTLVRKTSIYMGKATMAIAGSLSTVATFIQGAGGGSVGSIGTLGRVFIAGGGAVKRGVALLLKLMR